VNGLSGEKRAFHNPLEDSSRDMQLYLETIRKAKTSAEAPLAYWSEGLVRVAGR